MGGGEQENWSGYDQWHLLFNELCNRAGHFDNAKLAGDYCSRLGRRGGMQFETAVRNLRNWRAGKHIPRQRNFMILSHLLDVARDPGLMIAWNSLYARARETEGFAQPDNGDPAEHVLPVAAPLSPPVQGAPAVMPKRIEIRKFITGIALFCGGVVAAEVYRSEPWLRFQASPQYPLIVLRPHVSLVVGESLAIHGDRGDCGKPPPDWEYVLTRLPISRIGTFSDGGVARRNSNFCRGETPARAVMFTADRPGVEELLVLGDVMRVTVEAAPM